MNTISGFIVIVVVFIILVIILCNLRIYVPIATEKFNSKNKTLRNTFQLNTPIMSNVIISKKGNILKTNKKKKLIQKIDIDINPNIIDVDNDLDTILLNYYTKQDKKNMLVSSFSLLSCSALLLQLLFNDPNHALSEELNQLTSMFKIMDLNSFISDLSKANMCLNEYINSYNLVLINSNIIIKDSYKKKIKLLGKYKSFDPDKAENVVIDINNDIKNKTNGMIPQIVINNDIDSTTTMILLNSIYFKGSWLHKFNKSDTITKKFNGLKGEKQVQMMVLDEKKFYYFEDDEKQVICLEYKNDSDKNNNNDNRLRISMVIILPSKNIHDVSYDIKQVFNKLFTSSKKRVDIEIPKFECESSLDLIPFFKNHNVTKIFEGIDISNILEKEYSLPVFVSKFIQKTKIIVDENGTEAAAVTLCVMNRCAYRIEKKYNFIADHPFKYYIIFDKSLILFSGAFI